jgi:hypothetical protein
LQGVICVSLGICLTCSYLRCVNLAPRSSC